MELWSSFGQLKRYRGKWLWSRPCAGLMPWTRYTPRVHTLAEPLREILSAMKAAAEEVLPGRVDRVTLFGSTARGEATEDSDFDLLVVLDEPTFRERASVIDRLALIAMERSIALSPVVLARREWLDLIARERRFPIEVERDGISA
jgi:uncharacterized protein